MQRAEHSLDLGVSSVGLDRTDACMPPQALFERREPAVVIMAARPAATVDDPGGGVVAVAATLGHHDQLGHVTRAPGAVARRSFRSRCASRSGGSLPDAASHRAG